MRWPSSLGGGGHPLHLEGEEASSLLGGGGGHPLHLEEEEAMPSTSDGGGQPLSLEGEEAIPSIWRRRLPLPLIRWRGGYYVLYTIYTIYYILDTRY